MKRILIVVIALLGLSGAVAAIQADKVTICHATSTENNEYVRIVVSENAIGGHFENPGTPKAGHEDDILLDGDVECPGAVVVTPPAPPTPPVAPPVAPTVEPETPGIGGAGGSKTITELPSVGADGK